VVRIRTSAECDDQIAQIAAAGGWAWRKAAQRPPVRY
jgi:hypothetical protein